MKKNFGLLAMVIAISMMVLGCPNGSEDVFSSKTATLEVGSCGSIVAPIIAGNDNDINDIPVGNVAITNTTTDLVFNIVADPLLGWSFQDLFVFAGTGDIPTDPVGGWQDFLQFPYIASFNPTVTTQNVTIPLADLLAGNPAGQNLNIAVYVVAVQKDSAGNVIHTIAGWSRGENWHGCGCYGVAFPYTVCGGTVPTSGCTYTQGYWRTHHEAAKTKGLKINWPLPMDEKQLLCGADTRNLLTLLNLSSTGGNAYLILARQYIAAKLNITKGASSTVQVDAALAEAKTLLEAHCGQFVSASSTDGQLMVILATVLDGYNKGLTGPGHCTNE